MSVETSTKLNANGAFENGDLEEQNNSILDYLNESNGLNSTISDIEIFQEINRLSDNKDERSLEEIIKEAETLIQKQPLFDKQQTKINFGPTSLDNNAKNQLFSISCESTPLEMRTGEFIDLVDLDDGNHLETFVEEEESFVEKNLLNHHHRNHNSGILESDSSCSSSPEIVPNMKTKKLKSAGNRKISTSRKKAVKEKLPETIKSDDNKENDELQQISEIILPAKPKEKITPDKSFCDKSTNPSPTHSMVSSASFSWAKERELERNNEVMQEKLKDTEERFQSLKIQYDSLSQIHRVLRENHSQVQEETDKLKIDVQHLNECANVLRSELQSARNDRDSALEIQKILQSELDESRMDKKKYQEVNDRDAKTIQDLQRQCREMERILMRKHPDSVSALIVASKNSNNQDTSASTRKLLEQRIAQLEADAKEQDKKAQNILANVQSRFNSVQAKYETHIQDLETQVLSLQEINSKLNEKLFEQSKELLMKNTSQISSYTQTMDMDIPEKETIKSRTIAVQTDNKETKTVSSNTVTKTSSTTSTVAKKPASKIPNSHSDSSIQSHSDSHLLATIRGMRVELAIKEKAVQRLTRDLDECKKTIRKLQKERDAYLKPEKPNSATSKKTYDPSHYTESNDSSSALKEAQQKLKVMEMDLKALCDKRVQDLKCLQSAHERETAAFHETIRILQERLEERESVIAKEKRRSHGPIDYYALKAKVSSLEKRHSDREQRLHMLITCLSKGKMNGIHSEDLPESFDSLSPSCSSPVNKNL